MAIDDDRTKLRLRIFAFVALILFGALVARLWFLQGIEYEVLQREALANVLEPVYEEAPRDGSLIATAEFLSITRSYR